MRKLQLEWQFFWSIVVKSPSLGAWFVSSIAFGGGKKDSRVMWNRRKFLAISLPALSAGRGWGESGGEAPLRFGVIADPQYADKAAKGSRHYRESLKKLRACIAELNSYDLEFTVTLGDLIDQDLASFDPVLSCYEKLKSQHRVVLGNHDFSVAEGIREV